MIFDDAGNLSKVEMSDISEDGTLDLTSIPSSKVRAKALDKVGSYITKIIFGKGKSLPKSLFKPCRYALKEVILPSGMTTIPDKLFVNCNVERIVIPEGVTKIGEFAFYHCNSMVNLSIPNGVTSIGRSAFARCNKLVSITLPDSVTSIDESAFGSCYSLKEITLPNSIENIKSHVFKDCEKLAAIAIPDSVKNIDGYAFVYCKSLKTIVVGNEKYDADCSDSVALLPEGCTQWHGTKIMFGFDLSDLIAARTKGETPPECFWYWNENGYYKRFDSLEKLKTAIHK